MKFLPYENITYRTQLSPREVIRRLSKQLDSPDFSMSDFYKDRKPYMGKIENDTFEMNTIYRGSMTLFKIIGKLDTDNEVTIIDIKMRLPLAVKIFIIIWCVPFIAMLIAALINPAIQETSAFPIPIILGVLILTYLSTMYGFKRESIRAGKHLEQLFEAEIEIP